MLHLMADFEQQAALLSKVGKHTTSKACLYIKRLSDVDAGVLRSFSTRSTTSSTRVFHSLHWEHCPSHCAWAAPQLWHTKADRTLDIPDPSDHRRGRVPLHQRNGPHLTPVGANKVGPHDLLHRPIAAFHQDVRP